MKFIDEGGKVLFLGGNTAYRKIYRESGRQWRHGEGLYGDLDATGFYDSTFEVAAFDANGEFIRLTPHDDVIGHQTLEEVSQIMTQLQNDPESLRVDEFTDY